MLDLLDGSALPALAALLETRSVTLAARRLGVTQSAMSHSLARLREQLGDPLLVRTGRGMVLSARAEEMVPRLRAALEQLRQTVAAPADFDSRASKSLMLGCRPEANRMSSVTKPSTPA
jgi:DNA-binding transcriptional LysR family regulator